MAKKAFSYVGTLAGHLGGVTSIATNSNIPDTIVSTSRDKSVVVWRLIRDETHYGVPYKSLQGHNRCVNDVALSPDGRLAVTASSDRTLHLWDLQQGVPIRQLIGHRREVLSVDFFDDEDVIISASNDQTIKIWDTQGICRFTFQQDEYSHSVKCVRFTRIKNKPSLVSGGLDKTLKIWDLTTRRLKTTHKAHTKAVEAVAISYDGTLCASGGLGSRVVLCDLVENQCFHSFDVDHIVRSLIFSRSRYWLCAATGSSVKIWALDQSKNNSLVDELIPEVKSVTGPKCLCLAWSADGQTIFAGYSDGLIRVWEVCKPSTDKEASPPAK